MIGGMYQDIEGDGNLKSVDADVWRINGSYFFGNSELKIAYQEGEVDDDRAASAAYDSPDYDTFTIALDHNLSKRTELYALYTQTDTNSDAKNAASLGAGTNDWEAVSLGIIHKF
jgi:predicted porin